MKYAITFSEDMWMRIGVEMLKSKNPILEMTAKGIMEQIGIKKGADNLRKEFKLGEEKSE